MTARKTIARFGPRKGGIRVVDDPKRRAGYYVVQWTVEGAAQRRFFPRTKDGRIEATAFAQGVWDTRRGVTSPAAPLTLRALWTAYVAAEWDSLRPLTQRNYREHWGKFETFLGRDMVAEQVRAGDLDRFRAALRAQGLGVGNLQRLVHTVKRVYRWADERELLATNRVIAYRFRVAKDERPRPPAEYSREERDRLLAALARTRDRSDGWRPWALVLLAAHQGKRSHQLLHLRIEDVDLARGEVIWRAAWEKAGKELRQPLTWAGLSAVCTALFWRARDGYTGPWLFYSAHARKQALGDDPRAVYHKASLWLALMKAERAAGIRHLARRGIHGARRGVAGDILAATRDAKLALDFIGDDDLRQAKRYLQVRDERLEEAAAVMDGLPETPKPSPNRHQRAGRGRAMVGSGVIPAFSEQARQDSNLQPPLTSESPTPARAPKLSTKSAAPAPARRSKTANSDPETVTKPSTRRRP